MMNVLASSSFYLHVISIFGPLAAVCVYHMILILALIWSQPAPAAFQFSSQRLNISHLFLI